jgi:hypothetical protein
MPGKMEKAPEGFGISENTDKVVFLDIDGVPQVYGNGRRFDMIGDGSLESAYSEMERLFGFDCRRYDKYDVAAVYYDWDKGAVGELKRILDTTGAKIVLSSAWRFFGPAAMTNFFRIHGLDGYYADDTEDGYFKRFARREKDRQASQAGGPSGDGAGAGAGGDDGDDGGDGGDGRCRGEGDGPDGAEGIEAFGEGGVRIDSRSAEIKISWQYTGM